MPRAPFAPFALSAERTLHSSSPPPTSAHSSRPLRTGGEWMCEGMHLLLTYCRHCKHSRGHALGDHDNGEVILVDSRGIYSLLCTIQIQHKYSRNHNHQVMQQLKRIGDRIINRYSCHSTQPKAGNWPGPNGAIKKKNYG